MAATYCHRRDWQALSPLRSAPFPAPPPTPAQPSGILIQWSSVAGKTYTVLRSGVAGTNYSQLGSVITATNDLTLYYDSTATGQGPYFYRLKTQ
jgi:hypothetical protein